MAEAVLVMTILGIIATIMITTLKPAEFKERGLKVLAQKVIAEIDNATTQILLKHSSDGTMNNIYILNSETLCTGSNAYSSNTNCQNNIIALYKKYMGTKRSMTTPIESLLEKYDVSYNQTPIKPNWFDNLIGDVAWGAGAHCPTGYICFGDLSDWCLIDDEACINSLCAECLSLDNPDTDYCNPQRIAEYCNSESSSSSPFSSFELKDGAVMIFYPSDISLFKILVDINGGDEPNVHNKDLFWLYVTKEGVDYELSECPNCS